MTSFDEADARRRRHGHRFAQVDHVTVTGSTNADLLRRERSRSERGAEPGEWTLVADHQTAGRGRLDHTWEDEPAASLLVSVLIRPRGDLQRNEHGIGAVVGLAALDAVHGAGATDVGLKWPNDLVVPDGRKLAGILLKSSAGAAGITAVVAGVGCNVQWSGALPDGAVDLAGLGASTDRTDLLVVFLERLEGWLAMPASRLRDAHRTACLTLGQRVRVDSFDRTVVGLAEDLSADGALVVVDDDHRRHEILVGDVTSLRESR